MTAQRSLPLTLLNILTGVALVIFLYMALIWAPPAANLQGAEQAAQRIFYIHMGNNAAAGLAFLATFVAGILYLVTRRKIWDTIGLSGVELGIAFATGTLITGSIWAKPTWNTYWTWDPRLTTSAIVWLLYIAYLMLRGAVENPEQRARFAAVYGIFASVSLPLVYYSANWFRSLHQPHSTPQTVDASMKLPLRINAFAFLFLMIWFIWRRYELLRADAAHESTPPPA